MSISYIPINYVFFTKTSFWKMILPLSSLHQDNSKAIITTKAALKLQASVRNQD